MGIRQLVGALSGIIVLSFGSSTWAQELSKFAFEAGGGFTQTVGNTNRHLDNEGWNIAVGAGYNFSSYFGTVLDLGYNHFGINTATLTAAGFPGGDIGVFSATLDPIVHLAPGHRADLYIIGGAGLFHTNQEFTQPTATSVVGFDPFLGFYNALIPTTQILASYSVNKPGIDVGAGFAVGTKWRGKLFAEARYNRIFMGNERHIDYIPVTFGVRW